MNTTTAAQSASNPTATQVHLEEIDRLLKGLIARTNRENLLTWLFGILALGVLGGYFSYGYNEIASALEPKALVGAAESWIEDKLPEVRKAIEVEVDKSAPDWAENLSKRAQSSLPTIRKKLEDYVLQQVEKSVAEAVTITEDHFRQLLREKRDVLAEGFKDLANSPELAKESLARLENVMDGVFQSDMRQGAADVFATLNQMTAKLVRLKAGQQLNAEEAREREVLMQFRRLQEDRVNSQTRS